MASRWDKARDLGIEIAGNRTDFRVPCPACSPHRRKKRDPCLHVTVEATAIKYQCFHCHDFKGILSDDDELRRDGLANRAGAGRGARGPARTGQRASRWY